MSQNWGQQNQGQYPPPRKPEPYYNNAPGPYNPGPSQPYAPSAPPPAEYNDYSYKPNASERFKSKKSINDPIFLILFVLQVILTNSVHKRTFDVFNLGHCVPLGEISE